MKTDYINPDSVNSLYELFKTRVTRSPDKTAYHYYDQHSACWQAITWQSVYEKTCAWANALAHESLQAGDRVAVMARNSVEWIVFEQASFARNLVVVPLYSEDRAENIAYIIEDAEVKLMLVDDDKHLQRLHGVADRLQSLSTIISLQKPSDNCLTDKKVYIGDWLRKPVVETAAQSADRDELASIVYTSGTTGKPKGVMLSHDNILQNTWAGIHSIKLYPDDHFLSFLPISHMLERTVGYYMPMMSGARVSFSRSITELAEDILNRNPSVMITVPRIFERIYNKIEENISGKSRLIRTLFHYSVEVAWQHFQYRQNKIGWNPRFLLLPLFKRFFHDRIREKFGRHFRFAICGGAALDFNVARLFIALDITIAQGYGLTEFSPVISVNRLDDNDPKSVGRPLPGVEISVDENKELLVKGKCVMHGYWKHEQATREVIDEQGWLHTGDQAELVDERIYITGRLKDIIVLSTGEKVPPCEIEQSILQDPIFENVVVVGENLPYLSALVIPNYDLAAKLKNGYGSLDEELLDHIKVKMSDFPGYARIHKIGICEDAWTIENGMLTPTLKPRRQYIIDHYKQKIDDMYHGH